MLTITKEISLSEFETWAGATDTVKYLTHEELETVEQMLYEMQSDGSYFEMTETQLNDFLWFETDTIAEWLGYNDFDEIIER